MRHLTYRAHEWLADHLSWVQYPKRRPAPVSTKDEAMIRLNRRVRRVFWAIAIVWMLFSFGGAGIAALFEPRVSPTAPSQPGADGQGKPRLNVFHSSDSRWA